jgi:CDGSH-type Zn-finger protein
MAVQPKITCAPNGPLSLRIGPEPVASLRRSSGEPCVAARAVSLCRCGGSKTKPFCDGTHSKIGFSDQKTSDGANDKRVAYAGKRITIFDNRALCSHAGACTDGLKEVFRYRQEPWIDPDGSEVQRIIETIGKCPSGALSYAIDGVEAVPSKREPMVMVTDHGPYAVMGGVELAGVKFGDGASPEHYTLCRCGASKNKPFCDGSHWDANFRDPA